MHYRITAVIGAGGMGEVYRATDTKLGRDVALKVLPQNVAGDPERLARFQREARAIAALNHPNVVTIYSVEESEGVHFLTMELIEGEPLDRLIAAQGLSAERIVEMGSALAEALAAAHEKGILHRDLKPPNVMVTPEGRVKVLDFGLAKELSTATHSDATLTNAGQTQAGVVMGTPAYMSPEQVSGRALDHRTDIFSLGVVLHEMATGQRPFAGTSSAELISSIMRDSAASVTDLRPDLPADLARIIRRCLEKDPRYRLQTARDVSNEFRDLARLGSRSAAVSTLAPRGAAAPGSGPTRADEGFWVAVLPFKYAGSNPDITSLAEGLTDDIVTNMSKFSYLRVIARSSTAHYAQKVVDLRAAAKDLGARYVMEGSIRQAGAKIRIAVQLVDASTGASLWAETYDRMFTPEATLELLDDVVPRIVATVGDTQGILAHSMTESLRNRAPESLTPYEALLRSFGFHHHVSAAEHLVGRMALERAVKQAPDRADCWGMLSWLYRAEYTHGFNPLPDPMDRSLAAARRSVELAPSNSFAHGALASAFYFRREFGAFRTSAERALALNRMEGYTTGLLGLLFAFSGDWERGCALAERSTQLNPNHPGWYWLPLVMDAYRRREGERALEYALKVDMPGLWFAQIALAVVYSQLCQTEQARSAVRELLALRPEFATDARQELEKWFHPEIVEQMLGDLRSAGLEAAKAAPAPAISSAVRSSTGPARTASGQTRADEGFWVAVLPLRAQSGDADFEALADGLTEDITSGLSRFPYLQVIAHNSAMAFKGRAEDIRTVGRELGARFVLEGSVRKRGSAVRVSAQLLDAASGTQLWADTYDREISRNNPFEIQDDLTDHIVTTVADGYGVLVRSIAAPTRERNVDDLSASELALRYYAFMQHVDPQEHAALRAGLERALEREPNHAIAWACLSDLYLLEYHDRFNPREKPIERAREAAWRSIKIDPACQMGWKQLAEVHFFSRDFSAFREAKDKAISLNPRDSVTSAFMAVMIAYSGDWERGAALAQRTMDLNRHHPGWYHLVVFHHQYRKREYEAALQTAKKINMPEFHWPQLMAAAACGMLGRPEEAQSAIELLRKFNPAFLNLDTVREDIEKWLPEREAVEQLLQGLQKAGFRFGPAESAASVAGLGPKSEASRAPADSKPAGGQESRIDSGQVRAGEGFWVAVLPFKHRGQDGSLEALAEGITEEIVTGLSRFTYLRVIARGSTAKYSSESGDVRAIGKELGARYVMEGSLRQAGAKLRLAVQLVDATSGAHLWAENYERTFSPESAFELQDDLVSIIVSTIADMNGVLPRSMSQAVRNRAPEQLSSYEAVLRSFAYFEIFTPEELTAGRAGLEAAVRKAPAYADAWAMLSYLCAQDYVHGYDLQPNALEAAASAARRAVELAPSNHLAYLSLAQALSFQKDYDSFREAAERAVALNPLDGNSVALLGELLVYAGDTERGMQLAGKAKRLNPNHPGSYWFADFYKAFSQGDYRAALGFALKARLHGNPLAPMFVASAYGQLGDREGGAKALSELMKFRPELPALMRKQVAKVWNPEYGERFLDGLRKAGMEIPDPGAGLKKEAQLPTPAPPDAQPGSSGGQLAIAVLPFANLSADPEQDYFSDGLAEEIINLLAHVPGLKVIARTSAFAFRGKEQDIRGIAAALGVRTVLEGSVRRSGTRVRVTAQLINADDGSHLWSERYDGELSDIFAVQDEISGAITAALKVKLSSGAAPQRYTPKLAAYEAFLKGRHYQAKIMPESLELARRCYEQACEIDPAFGMAHVGLGHYWLCQAHFGRHAARDCLAAMHAEGQRALQIDPSLPEAHALVGISAAMDEMDWTAAEQHFDFPGAKQASFELTRPLYAGFQFLRGNVEDAIRLAQRAVEEDPLEVWAHMNLHAYLQAAGREAEALDQLKKVLELDPNQVVALVSMATIYADRGDLAEALKIARRAHAVGAWYPDTVAVLAALLRRNGEVAESVTLAKQLDSSEVPRNARARAVFYLLLGDVEQGADWAEKSIEERDASIMYYLRFLVSKELRASHRWPKIARLINLPVMS